MANTKTYSLWDGPETVGELVAALSKFPEDWPIKAVTSAGGGLAVEHREIGGLPVVALFGKNGGRIGDNPLTEDEYRKKSREFMDRMNSRSWAYTSIHGDHRLYMHGSDTCYGTAYDPRIVERMVSEGLFKASVFDLARVRALTRGNANQQMYPNRTFMSRLKKEQSA